MKKQLLGTTALVAAGLFVLTDGAPASAQQKVEPIKVTVGGYMTSVVSYVSQDDVGNTAVGRSGKIIEFDQHTDQEIIFTGRTTLANGILIGGQIQLEGNTEGDQIDESYLFAESNFGRLEMGQINNVAYRMHYKAPDVFSRGWLNEGNIFNTVVNPTTAPTFDSTFNLTSLRFADNDSDKINYYTPRFAGFQFGASYIPDSSQDTAAPRSASAAYSRGWAVGANFVRTFGDFDVAVAGGYMTWQGPQTAAAASAPDPDAYSAGLQLGYAGFRVGASYARIKDGRQGAAGGSGAGTASVSTAGTGTGIIDGDAWDVGASYTFGPASVSLTYFEGSNDSGTCSTVTQTCTTIGEDELTGLALAGKYILGPGISWDSVLFYAEVEGFNAAGSAVSNEAAGVVTGFTLAF